MRGDGSRINMETLRELDQRLRAEGVEVPLPNFSGDMKNPVSEVACYLDEVLNRLDRAGGVSRAVRQAVETLESDLNRGAPSY